MPKYTQKQVSKMLVNPYSPGDIREAYPFIAEMIPANTFGIDLNKFFRYLSFVYDDKSPMAKDYTDMGMRKKEAAREVLFNLDHEADFRSIAFAFLCRLKNQLWTEIVCNESLFWECAQEVMAPKPVEPDEKLKDVESRGKMLKLMSELRIRWGELRKEFFGSDEVMAEFEALDYRPESMNKRARKAAAGN